MERKIRMKILVTGANGMLAKEVKEKFEKENEIIAIGRQTSKKALAWNS